MPGPTAQTWTLVSAAQGQRGGRGPVRGAREATSAGWEEGSGSSAMQEGREKPGIRKLRPEAGQRAAPGPQASPAQFPQHRGWRRKRGMGSTKEWSLWAFCYHSAWSLWPRRKDYLSTAAVKALSWLHPHPPVWWGPLTAPKNPSQAPHFMEKETDSEPGTCLWYLTPCSCFSSLTILVCTICVSVLTTDFIFLGSKITANGECSQEINKTLPPWKKSYDKSRQCIQKQRHHFADKGPYSQYYGFSSSHVQM